MERTSSHGVTTRIHRPLELEPGWGAGPCAVVIFGATGDLTRRKLVPALYALDAEGSLPDGLAVVGMARRELDDAGFRRLLREGAEQHAEGFDPGLWEAFAQRIGYARGAFGDAEGYRRLGRCLDAVERERCTEGNRLFYLATPPDAFPVIVERLAEAGLLVRRGAGEETPRMRVVVEKPFGHDLESARELNRRLLSVVDEDQIYRIDHYLGKETVQNILVFRFGNSIFEPLWNRMHVDHVQITAAEEVDVAGRGRFYDRTGVLRDIVQNHLLQVLSLVAMETPVTFGAEDVRDQKVQVLRSLRRLHGRQVGEHVVRAQYAGYAEEEGVGPGSATATYCALKVFIDSWRWQGVPFYVRTGKALARKVTEVAVRFHALPFCLFGDEDVCSRLAANELVLRIQPDEGIALCFNTKVPGKELAVSEVDMDFDYAEGFGRTPPDAYQRLLVDAIRGDATLFTRADGVEHAWRFIMPILEAWEAEEGPPPLYAKGSAGPAEADRLLRRDGHLWRRLG